LNQKAKHTEHWSGVGNGPWTAGEVDDESAVSLPGPNEHMSPEMMCTEDDVSLKIMRTENDV